MGLFDRFKKPKKEEDISPIKEETKESNNQEPIIEKPKWEDDDFIVRKSAVNELNDQETLIKIAKNDPHWSVRSAAAKKITDESVLIDIAMNDPHETVRGSAIENDCLKDNQALYEIAINEEGTYYTDILKKITDENLLIELAKNKKDAYHRDRAISYVHNQSVLIDFAYNDKDEQVRNAALSNVHDEDVLKDMIYNGDYGQKMTASKNITDPEVIIDVAFNEEEESVRENVIEKITDEQALKKLAKDKETLVRRAAIENTNLKDESTLKHVARNDENKPNRDIASERLKNLNVDITFTQEELIDYLEKHELYSKLSDDEVNAVKHEINNGLFIYPDTVNEAVVLLVAKKNYE